MIIAVNDVGFTYKCAKKRQRCFDTVDDHFVERAFQTHQAFGARLAVHDQFADKGIVIGRDGVALIDGGIDADAEAARRMVVQDLAGRGAEGNRVLGVDAALDGVPVELYVVLLDGERAAGGNADLLENQIDVGDHLGHRMLHLNARVHLDEAEFAVFVEKLDGADPKIADRAHGFRDRFADRIARTRVERGRGAFFPDFLVAALQRAVALAQVNRLALAVAKDLDFDMTRSLEIFLDVDGIVTEGGLGFGACRRQSEGKFARIARDFHAAATAAGRRLDQNGIPDVAGDFRRFL